MAVHAFIACDLSQAVLVSFECVSFFVVAHFRCQLDRHKCTYDEMWQIYILTQEHIK